jgi:hypothetical protein
MTGSTDIGSFAGRDMDSGRDRRVRVPDSAGRGSFAAQLRGQRLQFTDNDRRRLAVRGHRLGRRVLRQIASVVIPDTILRWHRQLIVRKCTYLKTRGGRHDVLAEIRLRSCGWRWRIPPGATRGSRVRSRMSGITSAGQPLLGFSNGTASRRCRRARLPGTRFCARTGRHRGGRLLHDGSLDVAGVSHVLHRVRDRPRITACSYHAVHAASG